MFKYRHHYHYLEIALPDFFEKVGVRGGWAANQGIIGAHGDKCSQYKQYWEENGLHFYHGVAIYLLSYCPPFADEVRETKDGWVNPRDWVFDQRERFLPFLPDVEG